jgi:hypothetical protein
MLAFKVGKSKKRIATSISGGIRATQNWSSRSMHFSLMMRNSFKRIRDSMTAERTAII